MMVKQKLVNNQWFIMVDNGDNGDNDGLTMVNDGLQWLMMVSWVLNGG